MATVIASAETVASLGYRDEVTAEASQPFSWGPPAGWGPSAEPALSPDMTPAVIRDALIDEERAEFQRDYEAAMVKARKTFDLKPVFEVLSIYHPIAVATQQEGAQAHRALLAKAEVIARTGKNPDARPYEELQALLDKRLGR